VLGQYQEPEFLKEPVTSFSTAFFHTNGSASSPQALWDWRKSPEPEWIRLGSPQVDEWLPRARQGYFLTSLVF
jgi:hypothetical protein